MGAEYAAESSGEVKLTESICNDVSAEADLQRDVGNSEAQCFRGGRNCLDPKHANTERETKKEEGELS